jgi:hypothetical protein
MSGLSILRRLLMKQAAKGSGQASGIMSIGKDVRKLADRKLQSYITAAKRQGVDLDKLSEQEIKYMLELNKPKPIRAIAADSPEGQGITRDLFNMLDRRSGKNVIKTDFGKPFAEEIGSVDNIIKNIKTMKPIDSMKETNRVLRGEGKYKNLSKADREKIVNDESVTDHIFERNIIDETEDFAYGGVAGMLGERQNFAMGRRAFMKLLGGVGAGIGALKTGAFKLLGKEAAPVAKEVVKSAGSGTTPPPYFFNLVNKIKNLGNDVTPTYGKQPREKVTRYKDYELTENITTGEKTIQRFRHSDHQYYDENLTEEVYMNYKPGKGQMDETTKGKTPPDEYTEDTGYLRTSGPDKGELYDTADGIPEDVIKEGTMFEDNITEFGKKITKTKKASGGIARMLGE